MFLFKIVKDKKMKKISIIIGFIFVFSLFFQIKAFSSQNPAPNTCSSGAYPISNPISRGIQRVLGLNIITTKIVETIIKNEISKLITKGNVKVNINAYSAGDLIAGKIKSFDITGKNVAYNDVYLSSINVKSLCDFTYFDYKKTPVMLNSPLFVNYNAEIKTAELEKIFASDSTKEALQGIKIGINNMDFGKVDFTEIKPSINNGKINIKANLVYKRSIFAFKFPINMQTSLKVSNDKIFLTNLKFTSDSISNDLIFIKNSIELNNINIFDLKTIKKDETDIKIKKLKIVNDKIFIEGTFWQQQNTTL